MCTTNTLLCNTSKEYFSQLNPIAQKIAMEIECTKSVYGELWLAFSDKEKDDIINDTLIKPDLSLHYYNLLSSPTNSSHKSMQSLANVDADTQSGCTYRADHKHNKCYAYNGRNLSSFAVQKVGQKVVQDDVLGLFRDEHSNPFSYRTKSQINLLNKAVPGYECTPLLKLKADTQLLSNHSQALQQELAHSSPAAENKAYPQPATCTSSVNMQPLENAEQTKSKTNPSSGQTKDTPAVKVTRDSQNTQLMKQKQEFLVYAEKVNKGSSYYDMDERTMLIHSFVGSDSITSSISSATSDDDDEQFDDNEEKTLCEEVSLLDTDVTLRKGFDFLNNW